MTAAIRWISFDAVFGHIVRRQREAKGLTVWDAAKRLWMRPSRLDRIEKGEVSATAAEAFSLAGLLMTSPASLFSTVDTYVQSIERIPVRVFMHTPGPDDSPLSAGTAEVLLKVDLQLRLARYREAYGDTRQHDDNPTRACTRFDI